MQGRPVASLRADRGTTGRADARSPAIALAAVCLGFLVIQLDVTIVNVALPTIQREVGGTVAGMQWVVDAYTLAFASVMLTAGSAADRLGARRVFLFGLGLFTAGSAACAAAPGIGLLVAARAVQGLGASALLPSSLALLVHRFTDGPARARALGVWGAFGSLGVAIGPVVGGALVAAVSWRVIFLVNLPLCAAMAILTIRHVAESPVQPGRGVDAAGLAVGVAALGALTAGFIEAGQQGWLSPVPDALIAAGLTTGAAFVLCERRVSSPMLPLRLFRSRPFSAATVVGLLFNLCLYGSLICLSLYLQQARHTSAAVTGLLLVPMSAAVGAGSMASGWLTGRWGPRVPMLAGLVLAAAGAAVIPASDSLPVIVAGSTVLGLCALAMPAMTAVVTGSAGSEHAGLASGVLNAARQAGGALGVALLASLLTAGHSSSGSGSGATSGHGLSLGLPLRVAAGGYVIASLLAWLATRPVSGSGVRVRQSRDGTR